MLCIFNIFTKIITINRVWVCVCMYIFLYVYIYTYVCIYVCVHINVYIYTYIHLCYTHPYTLTYLCIKRNTILFDLTTNLLSKFYPFFSQWKSGSFQSPVKDGNWTVSLHEMFCMWHVTVFRKKLLIALEHLS